MLTLFLALTCTPPQLISTYFTVIISPLYSFRNRSAEKLSNLRKVTEQSKGTPGIQAQRMPTPQHVLLPSWALRPHRQCGVT